MSARPRHCERLTSARGPSPADLSTLPRMAGSFEDALRRLLEPFLGAAPLVRASPPVALPADALAELVPDDGHHVALIAAGGPALVVVSIGAGPLVMLLDRWFGGTGGSDAQPDTRPDTLPLSARMLAERLTPKLVHALDAAWSTDRPAGLTLHRTSDRLARLGAFAVGESLVHARFDVVEDGRPDWAIHVTHSADLLRRWEVAARPIESAPLPVAALVQGTLGGIGLPLRAIVDEPRLPLRRLNRLAVGDCIPLGVGGLVSLRLADRTVGHGVVGTSHGKVAVRVTAARPTLALSPPEKDLS